MKKFINITVLTILGLFSFSSLATRHCSDEDTIVYAQTLNHQKEVEICKVGERFRYTFGKIDSTPDIVLDRALNELYFNDLRFIKSVEIHNGNITYDVGFYTNGDQVDSNNSPTGEWIYAITVSKNDKRVASIELDPDTLVFDISKYINSIP